jgi:polar amino acid transport system substrate-binding protein
MWMTPVGGAVGTTLSRKFPQAGPLLGSLLTLDSPIDARSVPRGTVMKVPPTNRLTIAARMLGFLLAAGIVLLGCSSKKSPNALVVGMDLSYPPFETIDVNGEPIGVSVRLAEALADFLGRPLRIENIPFVGLIPSLQNKRIECIISSMTDTPERRQSIAFSDPYLSIGLALLAGARSDLTSGGDVDSAERTFVVRQGTTGEVWARSHLKKAKVLSVDKENSAVLEVVQGKADGFIYDQMSVWQNWKKHPDSTRAILAPLQKEQWAIGIRKDNEELRLKINAFLKQFRKKGGFERLADEFLSDQKKAFERENVPFYF